MRLLLVRLLHKAFFQLVESFSTKYIFQKIYLLLKYLAYRKRTWSEGYQKLVNNNQKRANVTIQSLVCTVLNIVILSVHTFVYK